MKKRYANAVKTISICGVGVLIFVLTGCVSSSDYSFMERRISNLEQRYVALQKNVESLDSEKQDLESLLSDMKEIKEEQEQNVLSQSAGTHVILQRLEEEIRMLNGRVEALEHFSKNEKETSETASRALQDEVAYNRQRIQAVENYLNLEYTAKKESFDRPSPSISKPDAALSEAQVYAQSKQAFDEGQYEKARQGFEMLLSKFPKSGRADNAQFWIGETYYRERWYQKAILEYQKVIENYPKGNKVPASMLKQALAFYYLGDKGNSRIILKELIKKYPDANESLVAKNKLKELQ
jgi:tol-pal system protein YbgF